MKKILIIVCSGTTNKGTEALIRGTILLLENTNLDIEITLASSSPLLDSQLELPHVISYIYRENHNKRFSIRNLEKKIALMFNPDYKSFSDIIKASTDKDLALIVGADNYDISYGLYPSMHKLNLGMKKASNVKLFLYDCSLNKESVNKNFIEEAKMFDAFSVRESETLNNLKAAYNGNNMYFIPDPAFVMPPKAVELPMYWKKGKMIGINLSTLIVGSAYGVGLREKVVQSYQYLMDNVIEKTPYDIVLIPHVMKRKDLEILEELYALYNNNDRVHLISNEDYTAPELKYIISNCRFFIGARTHATIAAYSTCVPTLVLGYSTKSIGIAKDLFGQSEGYVVPVQKMKDKFELWNSFYDIMLNEDKIKTHLTTIMPEYQAKVYSMSDVFKRLLS